MNDIRKEIVPLIRQTCEYLFHRPATTEEVALKLGTAAAESSLIHRRQLGGGPARGLWQMEFRTAYDMFDNYLLFRKKLYRKVMRLWKGKGLYLRFHQPDRWELGLALETDDVFACAMARIHYLRVPASIPHEVVNQAIYWKQFYNTSAGAGTVSHYLDQWVACGCEDLLREARLWHG